MRESKISLFVIVSFAKQSEESDKESLQDSKALPKLLKALAKVSLIESFKILHLA
ncbi:hypothetical protein [Helicobacter sp. MIT 14-3879]|uniref:hypothetical protein n=1 Tax=Helicobacter sp. MIT 14-3879 TaxID=2040649 RepID=UPI0015F1B519|nr:hypothetical protein [Helicobacter sp. MIT 14-3879]